MGGNKSFRKANDVGPVLAGLADEPACLLDRGLAIEKDRCGLHGAQPDRLQLVAHDVSSLF